MTNAANSMQQFLVVVTTQRTGPRGRPGKPVVDRYAVAAFSREEALAVFREQRPSAFELDADVSVVDGSDRVMRLA